MQGQRKRSAVRVADFEIPEAQDAWRWVDFMRLADALCMSPEELYYRFRAVSKDSHYEVFTYKEEPNGEWRNGEPEHWNILVPFGWAAKVVRLINAGYTETGLSAGCCEFCAAEERILPGHTFCYPDENPEGSVILERRFGNHWWVVWARK